MPKQFGPKRVRRCNECGYKTHRRFWEDDMGCPICESPIGFVESDHGGLTKPEIELVKKEFEKMVGVRGKERM